MEAAFGASDATGAWNWKTAYDACEAATVLFLRKYGAALFRRAGSSAAILPQLGKIAGLLPTHTRRSEEAQTFQQFSTPIPLGFAAVTAAAIAITAFPMLARIIHERGLAGTSLGTLALTLVMAGCVPPRQPLPPEARLDEVPSQWRQPNHGNAPVAQWWRGFGDPARDAGRRTDLPGEPDLTQGDGPGRQRLVAQG